MFVLTAIIALAGYHQKSSEAIVLEDETALRVTATENSPETRFLQAGELAFVEDRHGDFLFLQTPGGDTGWLKSDEVGLIWD